MAQRRRVCCACGFAGPTSAFPLVDQGLAVAQHRALRRRCPNLDCQHEGRAWSFAIVPRLPPGDRSSRSVA